MTRKWHVNEDKVWFTKWWPEGVPKNIEFEEITLGQFFEQLRIKYGDHKFIWFLETEMTYEETGQAIDSFATALEKYYI